MALSVHKRRKTAQVSTSVNGERKTPSALFNNSSTSSDPFSRIYLFISAEVSKKRFTAPPVQIGRIHRLFYRS